MAAVSVDLRRLAAATREIPRSGLIAAAKAAKNIAKDEGRRYAGADGIKGKKRRGVKLLARDDIRDTPTGAVCTVYGVGAGWVWATFGTDPHNIRRRKRGPMRKMTVHHPGTSGRRIWDRVEKRVADAVPRIFADEVGRVI